jgi:hypothetical protein
VKHIMSVEVPVDNRAGRDWQALLTRQGKEPIELQSAGLDDSTTLSFDGSVPLIESHGQCIALGPSEQAQINVIDGQIDRLPQQPQMIFTWTPIVSDTRVIDQTERDTLDLVLSTDGVSIGEVR